MTAHSDLHKREIHQVPGVLYAPLSGRAKILGTGLEVFEIIRIWKQLARDWDGLKATFDWLRDDQLQAALAFYDANATFVDERLAREDDRRIEELWARYPQSRPPKRP